ncbi:MAG: glycosyltransferase family 2 protein [Desulfosudaceae bacterium]
MTGVILAAGRGVRAYPASHYVPKALMEIAGRPLIDRTLAIMTDQLGVQRIVVVIGHGGDQIIAHLSARDFGVDFVFVEQKEIKGIGHALLTAESLTGSRPFVVMLGDEFYYDTNHEVLLEYDMTGCAGVVMFREEKDGGRIAANYTGEIQDGRVSVLIEKPVNPRTGLMGVGTFLLTSKIFDYIRRTPPSDLRNEIELIDALSTMARHETVRAAFLSGIYVNINNIDELNRANYLVRSREFDRQSITLVIPAYNEEETIAGVIAEFGGCGQIHRILVVDNNSSDRTPEIAAAAGARVVTEISRGYGSALRRGLAEADGDIIIITEADGSFTANDVPKFLEYLKDCDMVIGTRTTRQMIEQGANMGSLVRWGNVLYGKIIELLWWGQEPRFTDVGCTYRALWKNSYDRIAPYLRTAGPEFSPEMIIAMLICRRRVIEIPVTYRKRLGGQSRHSGGFVPLVRTAVKMMGLILKQRFRYR